MPVLVRPAAAADIDEAFLWYERKRPGLGEEFLEAIRAALEAIAAHPVRYPVIHRSTRRLLLRRFPYAVYYRVSDDDIHCGRLYARTPQPQALAAALIADG